MHGTLAKTHHTGMLELADIPFVGAAFSARQLAWIRMFQSGFARVRGFLLCRG